MQSTAAQCIIPRLNTEKYFSDESYKMNIELLCRRGIGGFCVFRGAIEKVSEMTDSLRKISSIPLIFCADFENGLQMRLSEGTDFPHAYAYGKINSGKKTEKMASAVAIEAKSVGIDWNLAPVCDINSNRKNPIINIRSFGEMQDIVSKHTAAYIKGTQSKKAAATAKHFPGHGDTVSDSHLSLPVLSLSKEELFSRELLPFRNAVAEGVKSVMAGHISIPALDGSGLPATLSREVIGILRNELKYQGIIISDAFDMNPIVKNFSTPDAAKMAFKAGINIVLLPEEPLSLIDELERIAGKDTELAKCLEYSSAKLLELKNWCGIFDSPRKCGSGFSQSEHASMALKDAFDSIEIRGDRNSLPIPEKKLIAGIAFLRDDDIEVPARFFNFLSRSIENNCDFAFVDENISERDSNSLAQGIAESEILILALFFRSKAYKNNIEPGKWIYEAIEKLSKGKEIICVNFGNPYISDYIQAGTHLLAFSDSTASLAAAAMKLAGREP